MALPTYMQYMQSAMGRQEDGTLRPAMGQNPNPPDNRGWLEKTAGDVWNTVTTPGRTLVNLFRGPPREITGNDGQPLSTYNPAMNQPVASELSQPSSANPSLQATNAELLKQMSQRDQDAQFARDQWRARYAALTDPNNPELRRSASLAGESAMAAARRAGVRGGYGINAGENAYNRAYQDQYMQRQQSAMSALQGLGGQVSSDRDHVLRAIGQLDQTELAKMGLDLRKIDILLEDNRWRTEFKLALERNDRDKMYQLLNTGMSVIGKIAGF